MSTVRQLWGPDGRWWEIRMDYREPGIVQVRPQSGIGSRSRPIVVSSLEAAMDLVNKQKPKGKGNDG